MSLILEALKKSEAERRLGQSPGLLDASPYARRRRRSPWLLLASIAALLAAVAIASFWLGQQERPASGPQAPTADAAAPTPAAGDPRGSAPDTPGPAPAPAPVAAEPAPPRADRPSTGIDSGARLPSDPGFASVERETRPQPPAALPHAVPVPPPPPPPAPAAPTASGATETAPAPPASAADSVAEAPASAPPIPPLSSLGAERRGRLPPLKVSMHVYAENPADRVALIDGRRLREGDEISPGLRLLEIRRDGSVLEFEGQRFLLPRS